MRAACYVGDGQLAVLDVEASPPGAGEVQIDVAFTGICGTDLHIVHGAMDQRVRLPAVLGHEMSGTVRDVGAGVEDWSRGDRVTVMPLSWCGACPACLAGQSYLCHALNFIGIDSPGSMQPAWTVPADTLVRLPAGLDLALAALAEPTAVAVHDVRRAGLVAGDRTAVVGGGPIGLLIACVARAEGADVLVLEPNERRRGVAERLGFRVCDPVEAGRRRAGGRLDGGSRRARRLRGLGLRRRASRRPCSCSPSTGGSSSWRSTRRLRPSTSSASSGAS